MPPSASNITHLRSQRSTRAPITGASATCGRKATIEAVASTVAEPDSTVSHQISAN